MTMVRRSWALAVLMVLVGGNGGAIAQSSTSLATAQVPDTLCPEPALSRLVNHRVVAGETIASIADQYNLIPATLIGFNPVLQGGTAPVGATLVIPPYNGVRVQAPSGSSWQDLASTYGVRADVLFEINGCVPQPGLAFIPGVNWTPTSPTATPTPTAQRSVVGGYPLPQTAPVITAYGWQLDPVLGEVAFHSGVDLSVDQGTAVLVAGDGVVAFVGEQGAYGNLVVVNHAQGLQTRYAQLETMTVQTGQRVRRGDRLGTVGATGNATLPHLHFEIRENSALGWVAQNPQQYVQNLDLSD